MRQHALIVIASATMWLSPALVRAQFVQQGPKLVGTGYVKDSLGGGANEGFAVALSADGNTAIVGGPNDQTSGGAVWIFTRSGAGWTQQGSKLVGTGGFGVSVALSADGNTAIVGGPNDGSDLNGAAWIFVRSGSTWTQQGPKLVGDFEPYGQWHLGR